MLRFPLLPAIGLALLHATPALADPTREELMRMRQPQCDAAYAQYRLESDAGGTTSFDERWWALDYFNAKAGRRDMLEVCGRTPSSLVARIGKGDAELRAIPFDTTSPDGLRWEAELARLRPMTVKEIDEAYGFKGSTVLKVEEPTELERLSVKLGGRNLLRFGSSYQFRSLANIEVFCSQFPGADCQLQRRGFSASWAAKTQREAKPRQFAEAPQPARSGGVSSAPPPSATVTVRNYDAQGNYLGSTVTTRTDASLMGAR